MGKGGLSGQSRYSFSLWRRYCRLALSPPPHFPSPNGRRLRDNNEGLCPLPGCEIKLSSLPPSPSTRSSTAESEERGKYFHFLLLYYLPPSATTNLCKVHFLLLSLSSLAPWPRTRLIFQSYSHYYTKCVLSRSLGGRKGRRRRKRRGRKGFGGSTPG